MRVLLLSTNTEQEPYPVYPLGMAVIASALTTAGHEVRQFDYLAAGRSDSQLAQAVQEFQPEIVGLSLRNIDNVDYFSGMEHWSLGQAREIIRLLRSLANAPVILGGPGFSLMPEAILEYLEADFGVVGEGEQAVVELLDIIRKEHNGPRIMREKQQLDPDETCPPLFDKAIIAYYNRESGLAGLQTKRGCPHQCAYCSYPSLEGHIIRPRDPEMVAEDMARLYQDHGLDHVFFTDSVFNDCQGNYLELALVLARRNLPVRWSAFFRPANISGEEIDLLDRSGLMGLEVGSDAGAEATLTGFNKGFSCSDIISFNEAFTERGKPVAHYFIIGGPGETEKTIAETLDTLNRLELCVAFIYSGVRILPGTSLHQRAIAEGIVNCSDSLLKPVYYHSPLIDKEAMHKTVTRALHSRRDRFFPPGDALERMNVMRRFGYRGLIWDRLISTEIQRRINKKNKLACQAITKLHVP